MQELQRRLDQTLGKPGSYLAGIDRVGNVKPMTVGARLYRVEQQLSHMDKKLDQLIHTLNVAAHHPSSKPYGQSFVPPALAGTSQPQALQATQSQPLAYATTSSAATPQMVPLASIEDDV